MLSGNIFTLCVLATAVCVSAKSSGQFMARKEEVKDYSDKKTGYYEISADSSNTFSYCVVSSTDLTCTAETAAATYSIAVDPATNKFALVASASGTFATSGSPVSGKATDVEI